MKKSLSSDIVFETICDRRVATLREIGRRHLRSTTAAAARKMLKSYCLDVTIEKIDEAWSRKPGFPAHYFHCCATRANGVPVVVAQGDGATLRGALVNALTDWEWRTHPENPHPAKLAA